MKKLFDARIETTKHKFSVELLIFLTEKFHEKEKTGNLLLSFAPHKITVRNLTKKQLKLLKKECKKYSHNVKLVVKEKEQILVKTSDDAKAILREKEIVPKPVETPIVNEKKEINLFDEIRNFTGVCNAWFTNHTPFPMSSLEAGDYFVYNKNWELHALPCFYQTNVVYDSNYDFDSETRIFVRGTTAAGNASAFYYDILSGQKYSIDNNAYVANISKLYDYERLTFIATNYLRDLYFKGTSDPCLSKLKSKINSTLN